MDRLIVTPEMLHAGAANCDSTASEIDGQLAELKSFVSTVQAEWRGVASDQFAVLMQDFDAYGRMLHDALTDIGNGLRGNYTNYVENENANIASLVAVNGDIPGAKL